MGIHHSSQPSKSSYSSQFSPTYINKNSLSQWQTIDHLDNYNLVRNIRNNILGQSRRFKLDALYDPQKQVRIYQMRSRSQEPIVKAYSAELLEKVSKKMGGKQQQSGGICASNNHMGVVTQYLPYSLQDVKTLTFPQCLYILRQSFRGYSHLYPRSGPVHITPKMLAINPSGNIKVWINQDYSQNHPNTQIKSLLSTRNQKLDRQYNMIAPQYRDQKQMIQNIIDVVQERCQNGGFSQQFGRNLRQNGYSFKNVREYLDRFIYQNQIRIGNDLSTRVVELDRYQDQLVEKVLGQVRNYDRNNIIKTNNNKNNTLNRSIIPHQQQLATQKQSLTRNQSNQVLINTYSNPQPQPPHTSINYQQNHIYTQPTNTSSVTNLHLNINNKQIPSNYLTNFDYRQDRVNSSFNNNISLNYPGISNTPSGTGVPRFGTTTNTNTNTKIRFNN